MVEQLELANHDVAFIAGFIDYLIKRILPGWKPLSSACDKPQANGQVFLVNRWDISLPPAPLMSGQDILSESTAHHQEDFVQVNEGHFYHNPSPPSQIALHATSKFANTEDKESQTSVASEVMVEDAALKNEKKPCYVNYDINGVSNDSSGHVSDVDFRDMYYDEFKMQECASNVMECMQVNESTTNRAVTFADLDGVPNVSNLTSECSYLSLSNEQQDVELKLELDTIEMRYQEWLEELSRLREEAIKAIENRWMTKKNLTIN